MINKIINCKCCGKSFVRKTNNNIYCSSKCKDKMKAQKQREYHKTYYRSNPYKPKKKQEENTLEKKNAEAMKDCMSYGKYVAMKEYGMLIER